jgi:CO/xanthine dehydrogenase Mo-binding subunit
VAYEARPPAVFDLRTAKEDALEPPQRMWPLSSSVGDADKAIAGAAVKIRQTYTMSDRHHNPMEPHVTLAVWDRTGSLTLYDATQMVVGTSKLESCLDAERRQVTVLFTVMVGFTSFSERETKRRRATGYQ